ncbi:ferredoxin--NADP reductase [Acuticoccus sp. MNP-M23]|uniref:ferredoxin--NADP reductase n=1 Tax=Acuticoccus sp. MNP-M23 TaxID=3072793 RepID=UPI0028164B0F|nr:ferredoxin--NADP reductase [Acuticoccus sp. MNP-M23]WMS44725.1 ferredoxin--NADP reductase [Acuticoccus sp. MNP-M23]
MTATDVASSPVEVPKNLTAETVTAVEHYTDALFRFRMTRPPGFRFRSGEFVMIGLPGTPRRAYSIASPSWDEELEFFSIKVPGGPLTEHLQKIVPGDTVFLGKKPTGTLVSDALLPGKRLFLFATGTGAAPFASVVRDPETYDKFERVIFTETCRTVPELRYAQDVLADTEANALMHEFVDGRLTLFDSATREPYPRTGRITDLIRTGTLFETLDIAPLDPATDRAMICGSMAMLRETQALLEERGFTEGANNKPGSYVVERAFVD